MSPLVPLPHDEQERIAALYALNILDTPPEERFERIVQTVRYSRITKDGCNVTTATHWRAERIEITLLWYMYRVNRKQSKRI